MPCLKYVMLGTICFSAISLFGQEKISIYNWKDSSKISGKNQIKQKAFLKNDDPYPPAQRDMFEVGVSFGNAEVTGDIAANPSLGGSLSLRKSLSSIFSLRGSYTLAYPQGTPRKLDRSFEGQVNFKARNHQVSLDVLTSLNPPSNHRGNPGTNIYILTGLDLIATKVFFQDATGSDLGGGYSTFYAQPRAGVQRQSQKGSITTFGGQTINGRKSFTVLPGASAGGGFSVKLNERINIGVEQRFTFTKYDYLDVFKGGTGNDVLSFTGIRINLNIGSSARRVEPLWWINPNNYVYNEINRPQHMKLPIPVLPDGDRDGVIDQFDIDPATPMGVAVDLNGVARDTDKDGVPDYKDKEPLTFQKCFPVNAEGVGNCPEPACCAEPKSRNDTAFILNDNCNLENLSSIHFVKGSARLSKNAKVLLERAALKIDEHPNCNVQVIGHGAPTRVAQQLSWARVNAVIRYLVQTQGITGSRFIFSYGNEGEPTIVNLVATKDSGPNTVPAPDEILK